jgi:hypothetical protein
LRSKASKFARVNREPQWVCSPFLQAHLPESDMAQVERAGASPPPFKLLSLMEMIQQAEDRLKRKL